MSAAIRLAREAFLTLARGEAEMPPRVATPIKRHKGTHLSMPCYVGGESEILIAKLVTVFEENPQTSRPTTMGTLILHNPITGELEAIMDAEVLTAVRTGAASALSADILADPEADTLGVLGAGGQARSQIEGMMEVRPIRQILIHSRTLSKAQTLAEAVMARFGVSAQAVETAREAVEPSRLVVCATNAQSPVVSARWLLSGTHVSAIGAFRPDMAELDVNAVGRCRVFVDRLTSAQAGAGDLIQAAAAGRLQWENVCEIGEVLAGKVSLAREATDITLFKSVGTAVQDAFAAEYVYRQALAEGVGAPIDLQ